MRSSCRVAALFCAIISPILVLAEAPAFINDYGYDREAHGRHPLQVFRSTDLVAPRFNILKSSPSCDDSLYTFLTPRGPSTNEPLAAAYDHEGHLVWATPWQKQQLYNLMVQEYKGEKYLTFWAGNDAVGGHGAGFYYMLDKHYNEYKKVGAANGLDGDLHDFRITEAGTALLTVYEVVQKDLGAVGKSTGPVWDCLIQEIDLETGHAVFQWRATDHYDVTDSYRDIGGEGEDDRAYDFFHINSIEKDASGNYLISARYTRSLTYIDGRNGDVIWIMGGKRNMFKDLSEGRATNFAYQHDARWSDDGRTITMFDNAVDNEHQTMGETRGLRLRVDQQSMTVALETEYINPHKVRGISQGSMQTLKSGNVLLGYGFTPTFTEFASDGTPLCDVHFGPESRFGTGDVQSYRVYKFAWQGWPGTKPDTAVAQDEQDRWQLYVSWNGATEVAKWELQGAPRADSPEADWARLAMADKKSFETSFPLRGAYPRSLRVVARGFKGDRLGASAAVEVEFVTPGEKKGGEAKGEGEAVVVNYEPLRFTSDVSPTRVLLLFVGVFVLSVFWRALRASCRRSARKLRVLPS